MRAPPLIEPDPETGDPARAPAIGPGSAPWLFAYGTLTPDGPEAMADGGWSVDAVRGRLFDLGPSPTLVDLGDESAGWVEGFVRPVGSAELVGRLDPYEGLAEGLYRRAVVPTRSGRSAWVYVFARPIPPGARGPLVRWDGARGVLPPGSAREDLSDGDRNDDDPPDRG